MRVELLNTKKTYNGKTVLDIDSLIFDSGKTYAILGANGSGKTTMLRILAGIDSADSGRVYYDGMESPKEKYAAYMPQSTYMFDLTVLENVILGIKYKGISDSEVRDRAMHALESVGMKDFYNSKARSLSGGEAQRVALARTLLLGKSLLLLDEPASATDIKGVALVENYIKSTSKKHGATIAFTTHNPSQASRLADEVIVMYNGRVIEKGSPSVLFSSPQEQETKDFLKSWRI